MDNEIENKLVRKNNFIKDYLSYYEIYPNKLNISFIQHDIDYMKAQRNLLRVDNIILSTVLYRQLCQTFKYIFDYSYQGYRLKHLYFILYIYDFINLIYIFGNNKLYVILDIIENIFKKLVKY